MKDQPIRILIFVSLLLLYIGLLGQNQNYNPAGTATASGNGCFTLTNSTSQAGAVWNVHAIDLTQPIDITLTLNFGNRDNNGADGMSFILQSTGTGLSSDGSGVGFAGIIPSFGVVMDTYENSDDPVNDHISIHQNGNVTHNDPNELVSYLNSANFPANVEDGNPHTFRFAWTPNASGGTALIYFDNVLVISYTGDIINTIFNGNPEVFWGVSASTGNEYNVQTVCVSIDANFSFTGSCTNQPVQFTDESYSGAPITSWSWNFGDGTPMVSGQNPQHIFTVPGIYHVVLTITNSAGLTSVKSREITVHETQIQISSLQTVCAGAQVTLNATINVNPSNISQEVLFTNTTDYSIPDGGVSTGWSGSGGSFASSPVAVSGLPAGWGINSVCLNINHSFDGDLVIYLKDPCGNLLLLAEEEGSTGNDFNNSCFSPSATLLISAGVPPFSGNWIPENGASSWNSVLSCPNPNGNWELLAGDIAGSDAGFIRDWSISFNVPLNYTYLWTPLNNSTSLTPTFTASQSGWYVLNATDNMGCKDKDSVYLTVGTALPVTISGDLEICAGEQTTLTVAGADSYQWQDNSTSSVLTVNPAGTTTYSVTGTSSTCTSSASATVTVNPNPTVSVNSETICEGQTATLTPQGADLYTWISDPNAGVPLIVNPATTTAYIVSGTFAVTGCSGSATATVTVNPNPVITIAAPAVCESENAVFTASGADNYSWALPAFSGNPLVISPATAGTYTVTVTGSSLNCTSGAEASLEVYPLPVADFSMSATEGCSPLKVNFTDLSQGNIIQWEWQFDHVPGAAVNSPEHIFSTPGQHDIQLNVTSDKGCKDASEIKIINVYSVNAGIASRGVRYLVSESILLFDASQGATQWFWDLGNGTTQNTENVTTLYNSPGEYIVQHIVSNDYGCKDTSMITLYINPLFTLYIPNAFTPNNDGVNDYWVLSGESWQTDEFEVYVFDRWGKMVFYTTDINVNWDGRVNGTIPDTQSVYQYRLRVRDKEGNFHEFWGSVNMVL